MVNISYEIFHKNFWDNWSKKHYDKLVEVIPKLLALKCEKGQGRECQQMYAYSIEAMVLRKSCTASHLKSICIKLNGFIDDSKSGHEAVENFLSVEYALEGALKSGIKFSDIVDTTMFNAMATKVFNKIQSFGIGEGSRIVFKQFIAVLARMESLSLYERLKNIRKGEKFAMTRKAIEYFSTDLITTSEKTGGWPEYILNTVQVVGSLQEECANSESYELLQKLKNMIQDKNEVKKDIAIMMSLVIKASSLWISSGSTQYMENIFAALGQIYDIVRDKSISSSEHNLCKRFQQQTCCQRTYVHLGLHVLETVRDIFVAALYCNNFTEKLVSACSNYMVIESEVLVYLDCKRHSSLVWYFENAVRAISEDIEKIVTTAGFERGKRTMHRLLSMRILSSSTRRNIVSQQIKINEKANDTPDLINAHAIKLLLGESRNHTHLMYNLHKVQKDLRDATEFDCIGSIIAKMPEAKKTIKIDEVHLQFVQLWVEIDFPLFDERFREKLIRDVYETDFYKNDRSCYMNLIKSGVCYLQSMVHVQRYKSNVVVKQIYDPLNEDFVLINNEIAIVKELQESLNYLAKFLHAKDLWINDKYKDDYIKYMEKLANRIGESLMSRHYKDLALGAFQFLYRLAEMGPYSLARIKAAGYLIENIDLHSTISEEEIVTELQSKIIGELKNVERMALTGLDDLGDFLLSFLQLTMYTMRYQHKMEHAKKYMRAINKLLCKYDEKQEHFVAVRLKYSEVMFEMIVRDQDTSITPITFIEDIFHRFKTIRSMSRTDLTIISGILFDLITTVQAFTQPRYEFRDAKSLIWYAYSTSLRNGYLLLFAKTTILTSSECLITCGKHLEDHMSHLDVLFQCKSADVQSEEVPKITWNKEITTFIHPEDCTCFQCTNKFLSLLNMEVAAVKAWGVCYNKDYPKSLQSYQQIYDHWKATNASSYSSMLMNYSNCLTFSCQMDKSKSILSQALNACNDSAQAQDISLRLLCNKVKEGLDFEETPSYANENRPKANVTRQRVTKPKKPTNCKPVDDLTKVVKPLTRRNLRN